MAGGKESPRQKMVGMMYLVLTALLAMNVTDQVLNAFMKVNNGLKETNANFDKKNEFIFSAFEAALKNNPGKTQEYFDKAKKAKEYCADLNNYIEEIQKELHEFGQYDAEKDDYEQKKDYDKVAEIMIGEVGPKKGIELKNKILETRKKLYELLDEKGKSEVVISLDAKDPEKAIDGNLATTWEGATFESLPLVAGMALLSKIQNDVKNAESDVVSYLMKSIDANDFKFDKLSAVVVAPTSYVLAGQPYEAQVFLTASDSKKEPEVFVNGSKLETEEGKGVYKAPTGKPGFYKWKGVIKVKKPDGTVEEYETEEVEYQVAEPSVNVSPDKMNVLYIGVENPITVSGAGIPAEKIIASISDGSLSRASGAGSYIAKVDKQGKTNVTVYYEPKPGERKNLGTKEFRVKRIPDPVCKFGGKASGKLAKAVMQASSGLIADLENFDFDARFTVKAFTFTIQLKSGDAIPFKSGSAYLTQEMKDALGRIRAGEKIYFDEIILNEPGGGTRNLQTGVVLEAL